MIPNIIHSHWIAFWLKVHVFSKDLVIIMYSNLNDWTKLYQIDWTNLQEATNKMLVMLQNAWVLPKPEVNRTIAQNALYWKWMEVVSEITGNNKYAIHALMKMRFLSKRKLVKIGWKRNYVNIEWSTKKLSVKQFTEYLDNVYLFFAENWYVLPTMDKLDMDSLINTYWNR